VVSGSNTILISNRPSPPPTECVGAALLVPIAGAVLRHKLHLTARVIAVKRADAVEL
jgi:hypothetical protein